MARIDCVARSRIADCCCADRRDGVDVDGFFEKWAFERIGFIENGEEFQFAIDEDALDRHFRAGNIFFDQGFARGRRVFHLQIGAVQQVCEAAGGLAKFFPIVGAHDALAGRE